MTGHIKKYGRSRRRYRRGFSYHIQIMGLSGKILIGIAVIFFCSVCAGAIMANKLDQNKYGHILRYVDEFTAGAGSNTESGTIFRDSLFKYSKTIMLIWILSFVPVGGIFALLVLGAKGMSMGFTTSLFIMRYGSMGMVFSGLSYLPQSIILLSGYFFVTYYSIRYVLQSLGYGENEERGLWEHLMVLMIGFICILITAAYEAYILPSLMTIFFI